MGTSPMSAEVQQLLAGRNVRHGDEIKNELILFAADNEVIRNHIEVLEAVCARSPAATVEVVHRKTPERFGFLLFSHIRRGHIPDYG